MNLIQQSLRQGAALLTGYLHEISPNEALRRVRPCVVICPGGGYSYCSEREKEPPALAFYAAGYHAFVLEYSVEEEAGGLHPLMELSEALLLIREHAPKWGLDPEKIAVAGFSAGGHLAASSGVLWDSERLRSVMDTRGGANRPDALVLAYPVISAGEYAHRASIDRVTGGHEEENDYFSLELQAGPHTPPAFLWHTADDSAVPVENTFLFAGALRKAGVPFECHIFQSGVHGLSMCNAEVNMVSECCAAWFPMCLRWLGGLFEFET